MKVFLAGAESAGRPEILIGQKVKYVLCSYYYMRDKRDGGIEQLKQYKDNGCVVFIDSGAHTFFSELGMGHGVVVQKETKTKEGYDEYFEKYLEWLMKTKGIVDHYVELDIQEIVGQEKVWGWRKAMRDKGLEPIVVLHPKASPNGNADAEWDKLTSEFSYCAIEGSLPTGRYISWLTQSERKNCRVHGFAMTKVDEMRRCKFYSVDSTSWIAGSRFGCSYYWKGGGRMDGFGPDEKTSRNRFKYELEKKAGVDWVKLEADDNMEIDKMNCYAWRQFAEWAEQNLRCNYEINVEGSAGNAGKSDASGRQIVSGISDEDRAKALEERRQLEEEVGVSNEEVDDAKEAERRMQIGEGNKVAGQGNVVEAVEGEQGKRGRDDTKEMILRQEEAERDKAEKSSAGGGVDAEGSGSGVGVSGVQGSGLKEGEGVKSKGKVDRPTKLIEVAEDFEGNKGKIQEILRKNPTVELERREKSRQASTGQVFALKHGKYASDMVVYCRNSCPKAETCPYWYKDSICYFDTRFRPIVERINSTQIESVKEALAMMIRSQMPRLAKNMGFEMLDGGYLDKNVTILADRIIQWTKDLHAILSPKPSAQINVGGDLTIQKIENVVDRLPDDKAKKLGEVLAEIECIDTTGDEVEGEVALEAEAVEEEQSEPRQAKP